VEPSNLQNASCQHSKDGDDKAYAHTSELGEAPLVSSELACHRDNYAVVDWNPDNDADGVKDGEGCGGDLEVGAHARIHSVALEDKHGAHLAINSGEDYASGPYWEETHDALEFLDLSDGAETP